MVPDPRCLVAVPTDPGGSKYMRYAHNGLGYPPDVRLHHPALVRASPSVLIGPCVLLQVCAIPDHIR